MDNTIQIPVLAAKAVTPNGFFEVYHNFRGEGLSAVNSYEKTEKLLQDNFGFTRYKNYPAFQRSLTHRAKKGM